MKLSYLVYRLFGVLGLVLLLTALPFFVLYDILVQCMYYMFEWRKSRASVFATFLVLIVAAPVYTYLASCIPSLAEGFGWAGAAISRMDNREISLFFHDTVAGHTYACLCLGYHFIVSLCRLMTFTLVFLANFPLLFMSCLVAMILKHIGF